jgi:hypothetical protein
MITELWKYWTFGSIGGFASALELLVGAVNVAIGCVAVLACLMGADGSLGTAFIERRSGRSDDDCISNEVALIDQNGQIAIRIESGRFRLFHRCRCVVTVREEAENAFEIAPGSWPVKDGG